jgi:hypothetical protein
MLLISMIGFCLLVPGTSTSAQLHRKAANLRAHRREDIVAHVEEGLEVSSLLNLD